MKTTTIIIAFLSILLNFNSYAQTENHSEEIQIRERIFATARSLSESQVKYKWIGDYYLDNSNHYDEIVHTILAGNENPSDQNFSDAVLKAKEQLLFDFNLVAVEYTKNKEKEITDGAKSNQDNIFTAKAAGEPCNNADFETGTFAGWELFSGNKINAPFGYSNMLPATPGTQHTIVTSGNDPTIPSLPKVFPGGGSSSVHLGDYGTGSKAASMKQTFMVDANSASYTYSYALVMEDPGHSLGEQPFFKVNMYDQNNNPIACATYSVIAGPGGDPGFVPYGGFLGLSPAGYYLPWRTTFIPLGSYVGQNVTIEFVVGDCSQGGHFGYAYIDAACSPLDITKSSDFICNGEAVTLTAPAGASGYVWSPGGATTSTMSTTTPGDYSVVVTPITGSGCTATLNIHVDGSLDHPVAYFKAVPNAVCIGDPIIITDSSYVIGTTAIDKWEWDIDGDGTIDTTATNPGSTTYPAAGNYDITLTITNNGCTSSKTISVYVNQGPDPAWVAPAPICKDAASIDLNTLVTGTAGGTWSGTGVTGNMFSPSAGTQTITYTVSDATCNRNEVHDIPVVPVPEITFTIPDEVCLKGDAFTLAATPTGGTFTMNGQTVTSFDPETNGVGDYAITYKVATPNYPQCFSTFVDSIHVIDGVSITADIPDYFCFGDPDYPIAITPNGGTFTGVLNTNSDSVLVISTAEAGDYSVSYEYTSPEGCSGSYSHNFKVGPKLNLTYTFEQSCFQNITLTAKPSNYTNYTWYDADSTVIAVGKQYAGHVENYGDNTFYLLATDSHGCQAHYTSTDSVNRSFGPELFIIPNVITPNGDGINDFMTMPMMDNPCVEYKVLILNRWGNLVWECSKTIPIFSGLDKSGAKLSDGVYFYKVVSKDFDCGTDPFKPVCYGFITVMSK